MVTEFQIMDAVGNVIGYGEMDGDIYRVFENKHTADCQEFENLETLLAACGGVGIQPSLFETPPRARQLNLLG